MGLTSNDRDRIAIELRAFHESELANLLIAMDVRPADVEGKDLGVVVPELLDWAEREGRVTELLHTAQKAKPKRTSLKWISLSSVRAHTGEDFEFEKDPSEVIAESAANPGHQAGEPISALKGPGAAAPDEAAQSSSQLKSERERQEKARENKYRKRMNRRRDTLDLVLSYLDEAIRLLAQRDRRIRAVEVPADLGRLVEDVEDRAVELENWAEDPPRDLTEVELKFDEVDTLVLEGLERAEGDVDVAFELADLAKRAYGAYARCLDEEHRSEYERLVPYWKMKLEAARLAKDEHEAKADHGAHRSDARAGSGSASHAQRTLQERLTSDAPKPESAAAGRQRTRATLDFTESDPGGNPRHQEQ